VCGIAGIYRRRNPDPSDPSRLIAMNGLLVHRGPDDFGYLLLDSREGKLQLGQGDFTPGFPDVCLGHRRLSIIDLSPQGRQPMSNETNDIFVVFNGEIFNYLELRGDLAARGHLFHSHSDTEVIVHAYEEWGSDCVTRFNGMWALVIWDQRRREMFCSRDRFGIKPFYYHLDETVFLFASEIKGILPALNGRPSANLPVLGDYLIGGSLCRTEDTFFDGIQRLPPAHNLIVSATETQTRRYWSCQTQSQSYDEAQPVRTFRDLLGDAVQLRLRSDVPVGIALSGGLDSSSILGLAGALMGPARLKAFTAVFPGESFNEFEYARLASAATGAELFSIDYQPRRFLEDLRQVIWSMDYPSLDGQVLSRWEIMRLAGRHVKVILEGQGADEMLAGYVVRYFAPYLFDELTVRAVNQSGLSFRELFGACRDIHHRYGGHAYVELLRHLAPRSLPRRPFLNIWASNRVYTPEFSRLKPGRREPLEEGPFGDRLTNRLHFDLTTGILPSLLKFGDALSMAFSVESRLPFLDHRLVEFVFGLPAHHKLRGSQSKGILRQAMAGVIPERIRCRNDKIGFQTPLARWIGGCMEEGVRPLLLSKRCRERGIFDGNRIGKLLTWQARGQVEIAYAIFRWVSVELWFRLFIDGKGLLDHRPVPVTELCRV
jgi:asparagine synthase (glutamine-hydrolysing)